MNGVKVFVAALIGAALALGSVYVVTSFFSSDSRLTQGSEPVVYYTGDPDAEALLVAAEDRRIVEVRAIANAAHYTNATAGKPYLLETGASYTLVLTPRVSPYTIKDLLSISPRDFVRQPDGVYVLSQNIVVEEGASLELSEAGLDLRLLSNPEAFVSIVTLGGSLTISGSVDAPVRVSSWDPETASIDTTTEDGRAFIHVVGGHAELLNANFEDLGFWSGMTGGVALTGTELADVPEVEAGGVVPEGNPEVYGEELIPTDGEAGVIGMAPSLGGYSYVTARIDNVTFSRNAFGLFITSADGVTINDTVVENSLVDGLVLHRDVKNTLVRSTMALDNARDGFSLRRATSGVDFDNVTATGNGRNGISLDGSALADGPNATGTSTGVYGNNTVSNSTSSNNGRYGIEVLGGTNVLVSGNTLQGNVTGIVVSDGAEAVTLKNNRIVDGGAQGISIRNAGTDAQVVNNVIIGGETGIYVRDAGGTFDGNQISDVSSHAITLVGATGDSQIIRNELSGSGPTAIDTARGSDAQLSANDVSNWTSTKPLDVVLRSVFQPLTVLWLILGLLVLFTAASGVGRRRGQIVHPYPAHAPLTTFTRGIVNPDELLPKSGATS